MGIQVMVIKTFQNPVLKSAKIRRCQKKSLARFLQKIKTTFLEHAYFPLLKLKMWFFVQEFAAELPFLSSVKIIFQKFRFFSQILSPIRLGAILCAHAILCAPTVLEPPQLYMRVAILLHESLYSEKSSLLAYQLSTKFYPQRALLPKL